MPDAGVEAATFTSGGPPAVLLGLPAPRKPTDLNRDRRRGVARGAVDAWQLCWWWYRDCVRDRASWYGLAQK